MRIAALVCGLSAALQGFAQTAEFAWDLPEGFPVPFVPADNPMSAAKVALGARLFTDARLSRNGALSCAGCHDPNRHFTDGRARAIGTTGVTLRHNAPTLLNSAYNASFGWTDAGLTTLEAQHRVPLLAQDPVEMGLDEHALARLAADDATVTAFREVFGSDVITEERIVKALACYVRTLLRGGSAFDALLLRDDRAALGPQAWAGLALFTSERLGCSGCHAGFNLSGPTRHAGGGAAPSFHRTSVSGSELAYRAPTLRFIRFTAPYMHDGSVRTLDDVIDFYARGGGPGAIGLSPFALTAQERSSLVDFLESL